VSDASAPARSEPDGEASPAEADGSTPSGLRGWRPRHVVAALLVLICLATTVALHAAHRDALVTLLPSPDMHELHVDFDTFHASAVALVHGGDIYDTPAKLRNLNPPLLTVLLAPTALLDPLPAYRVFAALTLLMVLGAVLAVARELRLSRGVTVAVALAVLASSPLHGTLVLGQIYPLLLVGLTAAWIAGRRGHPLLGAALVGVTVALKPSLAPLLLVPLALRRWRPAVTGWAAAAVASLLGILVAGPRSGLEWLRIGFAEPVPDSVDNASLPGLVVRMGLPSAVGTLLGLAVLCGTLAVLARRRDVLDPAGTAPWAVLAAGLLLSPIAWHNYLMLLWPGLLLLLEGERRGRGHSRPYRPGRVAVLLAVAIVPVSWNAIWPPPPEPWWSHVGRSLYFVVLATYWWVLLSSSLSEKSGAGSSSGERVADGVAASSASGLPPTGTGRSPISEENRGSSATASGAPGVASNSGGSSS
jgi:arabinofuranan 3-O-arabinosyltransferase